MVKDTVLQIIKDVTFKTPKKLSFTLDTLDVDSLDLVEITLKLENQFNIEFTDAECDQLRYWSINELIKNIESKIND